MNQIEYLGRSFAAKQTHHYNVVKYGDIVYTKSPTGDFPYGIIKRSDMIKDVAVSVTILFSATPILSAVFQPIK